MRAFELSDKMEQESIIVNVIHYISALLIESLIKRADIFLENPIQKNFIKVGQFINLVIYTIITMIQANILTVYDRVYDPENPKKDE